MEGAWVLPVRMCNRRVLPVRMCNRRDAIPPINMNVRYILTVCLPVLNFVFTILYVINSVHVVLGSDFAI